MADSVGTMTIDGLQPLLILLGGLGGDVNLALTKIIDHAAESVATHAKRNHFFIGTRKGATKRAKDHELDFMNPDGSLRFKVRTGVLRNSIQVRPTKTNRGEITGEVVAGSGYAKSVEYGRMGRSRAFPFMRPALEAVKPQVIKDSKIMLEKLINQRRGKALGGTS